MKNYWKTSQIVLAFVIIIGMTFWTLTSIQPVTYSGADLDFSVGSGPVNVTNSSDQAVPVQMVGNGSRSFRVLSSTEAIAGSSTREGSGSSSTQVYAFELPAGDSEFTISGGTDINFIATTAAQLEATVSPMGEDAVNATLIIAGVVVLGALFYASSVTKHFWFGALRRQIFPGQAVAAVPVAVEPERDPGPIGYGDNRTR